VAKAVVEIDEVRAAEEDGLKEVAAYIQPGQRQAAENEHRVEGENLPLTPTPADDVDEHDHCDDHHDRFPAFGEIPVERTRVSELRDLMRSIREPRDDGP
jgi:hypothetical protein